MSSSGGAKSASNAAARGAMRSLTRALTRSMRRCCSGVKPKSNGVDPCYTSVGAKNLSPLYNIPFAFFVAGDNAFKLFLQFLDKTRFVLIRHGTIFDEMVRHCGVLCPDFTAKFCSLAS